MNRHTSAFPSRVRWDGDAMRWTGEVENGVTNTAVLERLNGERCMELNLPYVPHGAPEPEGGRGMGGDGWGVDVGSNGIWMEKDLECQSCPWLQGLRQSPLAGFRFVYVAMRCFWANPAPHDEKRRPARS